MIDFSTLKELYLDGKKVTSLFLDGHEVPFGEETPKYFTVTALDNQADVKFNNGGAAPAFSLECSTDGNMWSSYIAGQTITLAAGKSVMFRRVGDATTAFNQNGKFWWLGASSNCKVSGNIASLIDASMQIQSSSLDEACFYRLFYNSSHIVDASELVFPEGSSVPRYGYTGMFQNTGLSAAPALPATTLATACYQYMFRSCASLSSLSVSFTSWNSSTGSFFTQNWLSGVAATGTFYCPAALGTNETITRGASNCPEGWTVVNPDAA